MSSVRPRDVLAVFGGGLVQLVLWLVIRPDRAGPQWTEGHRLELWLGLEAVAALAVGVLAPSRWTAVWAVVLGWFLQMLQFGFLGEHYDDSGLWFLGVIGEVFLAAGAVGLALLARVVTGRDRRRVRT